jgi:hypothetical protein
LSLQEADVWRMTAKVHIVRSELTVEGISGRIKIILIVRDAGTSCYC